MCASVIGKPDPQTEKLLEAIFGKETTGKGARKVPHDQDDREKTQERADS